MRARDPLIRIRRLFAILVALSVLFAPSAVSAAMATGPHDMQIMEAGHCQMPPSPGAHDKMAGKSCCIAMCIALAVAPWIPIDATPPRQQIAQFPSPKAYHGLPAEIATPPPRKS